MNQADLDDLLQHSFESHSQIPLVLALRFFHPGQAHQFWHQTWLIQICEVHLLEYDLSLRQPTKSRNMSILVPVSAFTAASIAASNAARLDGRVKAFSGAND